MVGSQTIWRKWWTSIHDRRWYTLTDSDIHKWNDNTIDNVNHPLNVIRHDGYPDNAIGDNGWPDQDNEKVEIQTTE